MTAQQSGRRPTTFRPPAVAILVAVLTGVKFALHAALSGQYDYNGDELYFIACGNRPSWGYVDHPPLVPWLAALAGIFDHRLLALRLPSALAGAGTVFLALLIVLRLGGGRFAVLLAGMAMLAPPAYLRMGSILCLPVIETFFWTLGSYFLVRLAQSGSTRWWIGIGVAAGLGLLTKHSTLLWMAAVLVGLLLTESRQYLRSSRPWLGAAIAGGLFLPNVLWQAANGWPTIEFLRHIGRDQLQGIPRGLFLLGQVLYMHPFTVPVWIAGLWFLTRAAGGRYRTVAYAFITMIAALLLLHGKPYYLAPAYPPLIAAGAVQASIWTERWKTRWRAWVRSSLLGLLALGATALAPFSLPILPLATADRWIRGLVGAVGVSPSDLTFEFHHEFGWREQARVIGDVFRSLPEVERDSCLILTGNYAQASAVSFFGRHAGLPPAVSGHMSYYLWGPSDARTKVWIVLGIQRADLDDLFWQVEPVTEVFSPLAVPTEQRNRVYVCRGPRQPWRVIWPRLKRFYFRSETADHSDPSRPAVRTNATTATSRRESGTGPA